MANERKYYVLCANNCKFESMTKEQILAAIAEATGATVTDIDGAFITKIKELNKGEALTFWRGTTAEYNALPEKYDDCIYIKTDDTEIKDMTQAFEDMTQAFENMGLLFAEQKEEVNNLTYGTSGSLNIVASGPSGPIDYGTLNYRKYGGIMHVYGNITIPTRTSGDFYETHQCWIEDNDGELLYPDESIMFIQCATMNYTDGAGVSTSETAVNVKFGYQLFQVELPTNQLKSVTIHCNMMFAEGQGKG